MNEIFLGFLAKTLNKPPEQIAELLYQKGDDGKPSDELVENAADLLTQWDLDRVKALRGNTDNKKALEDQRKRGYKEAREELEKTLREQYATDSDKEGADLVAEIVAKAAKSDLPEDKVKRHPLYLALEKRISDEVKALKEQHESERGELEKGYARKFTLTDVKRRALEELDKMEPVLPENASIAANYKRLFADAFNAYDFEAQEDGEYLVLKGEKRLEDGHGNPVGFQKLVKQTAGQFFSFRQQNPKESAGNKNGITGGNDFKLPSTMEEAWAMARNAKTPEERTAILEAAERL